VILACAELTYLDQRPVREKDRECAEVWSKGGLEAEKELKERWSRNEHEKAHNGVMAMMRLRDANLAKRGIDNSEEAQLKAVEDHGKELFEKVLKDNSEEKEVTEMLEEGQSVLDPILKSINLFPDFEETELGKKVMLQQTQEVKEELEHETSREKSRIVDTSQDQKPVSVERTINLQPNIPGEMKSSLVDHQKERGEFSPREPVPITELRECCEIEVSHGPDAAAIEILKDDDEMESYYRRLSDKVSVAAAEAEEFGDLIPSSVEVGPYGMTGLVPSAPEPFELEMVQDMVAARPDDWQGGSNQTNQPISSQMKSKSFVVEDSNDLVKWGPTKKKSMIDIDNEAERLHEIYDDVEETIVLEDEERKRWKRVRPPVAAVYLDWGEEKAKEVKPITLKISPTQLSDQRSPSKIGPLIVELD
jgi:hypothetical protein